MTHAPDTHAPRGQSRLVTIVIAAAVAIVFGLIGLGIGLYVALVNSGVINPAWTDANIAQSRARAARIIAALNEYNADHGAYPHALAALSPDYLADLPTPTAGADDWAYASTGAGAEFILQFSANQHDNPTSWYDSRHDLWFTQHNENVAAE